MSYPIGKFNSLTTKDRVRAKAEFILQAHNLWLNNQDKNCHELVDKGNGWSWREGIVIAMNVAMPEDRFGKYKKAWISKAKKINLPEDMLDKPVHIGGVMYICVGLMPRSNRSPVILYNEKSNKLIRISKVQFMAAIK